MTLPKPQLPKLMDIIPIADRPVCMCCGKPLSPSTSDVTDKRHESADFSIPPPPDPALVGSMHGTLNEYRPDRAYKRTHLFGAIRWHFWTGKFRGYGRDRAGIALFCTLNCAERFAYAAVRGGYAMPGVNRVLPKE